jgi:alkanesulfonate monooxygenase SsuD/methylene tetrahydromethanopterin reductase-like flavin-dependent oxidoreductase (luciferase family)
MTPRLRFGIKTAQMDGSHEAMREAWLEADALGFDTAWGHDHLLSARAGTRRSTRSTGSRSRP